MRTWSRRVQTAFEQCFTQGHRCVCAQQQWSVSGHLFRARELKDVMKSLTVGTEVETVQAQWELRAALSTPGLWPFQSRWWGWELASFAGHAATAAGGFPLISEVTMPAGAVRYSHGLDGSSVSLVLPYHSSPCQKLDEMLPWLAVALAEAGYCTKPAFSPAW